MAQATATASKGGVKPAKDIAFTWQGMDKKGKKVKGNGLAVDEASMRSELRRQGITVQKISKQINFLNRSKGGKITPEDIAIFSRQLATMMAAGIPMVQSFEIVGNGNDKPAMQRLILDIKADVEGGSSLHESLSKHPLYFDDLFTNLVEAGEQAGALENLLDKIATYKEKSEALKKKVKKALFYPAAVLVVAVVVTVILLIFVIPQFEKLFEGFGAELPAFTQMVINASRFLQNDGVFVGMVVAGGIYAFIYFKKRSKKMREVLDRMALKMPVIGPDPDQVGDRALRAHALDHVRRRRAAGRSAGIGCWRHRQHRVRRRRHEDARRSRDRHPPATGDAEHRRVS